ncbi:MAG: peroxiredoxin family protein [Steroidobacteraceae bacterium]
MAQRSLAGHFWPSADVIPEGSRPEEFENFAGIRYRRSDNPNKTPHMDVPQRTDKNAVSMRLATREQAPVLSARMALPLQNMIHLTPSSVSPRPGLLEVGDRGRDFNIIAADGRTVSLADFRGKPVVLMFMRVLGESLFCPYSIPATARMQDTHAEFTRRGIAVALILPTMPDRARAFAEAMELKYPVYADPEWSACSGYARRLSMLPLQATAILDGESIVRYMWRSDGGPGGDSLPPMPCSLLQEVDRLFPNLAPRA